jgi:hypothetical protein
LTLALVLTLVAHRPYHLLASEAPRRLFLCVCVGASFVPPASRRRAAPFMHATVQGRLLGSLDPDPRHHPDMPDWYKPDAAAVAAGGGTPRASAAHEPDPPGRDASDTHLLEHIACLRVIDDTVQGVWTAGDGHDSDGAGSGDDGDAGGVYITQMTGARPTAATAAAAAVVSPAPALRAAATTAAGGSGAVNAVVSSLLSPKKIRRKAAWQQLDELQGYTGVCMGAGIR